MLLTIKQRRAIRAAANAESHVRVKIVDGNVNPCLKGKSHYYTNKSGDIIQSPNAYRRAWGKPIYHHSTIRVEVGIDWIMANAQM